MLATDDLTSAFKLFLNDQQFVNYEFKDIRMHFIHAFPKYRAKSYYPNIYRIVRKFVETGDIQIYKTKTIFRYSNFGTNKDQKILDHISRKHNKDDLSISDVNLRPLISKLLSNVDRDLKKAEGNLIVLKKLLEN